MASVLSYLFKMVSAANAVHVIGVCVCVCGYLSAATT